jgi:1,4-alpha-glucan branching enzyme
LLPDKGQEWLIRALADVRKYYPGVKLLLAGDGPCRSALKKLAQQLRIADAVIFTGFVKDIQEVYAALDIFLLPSFFEALNNSLLAAMAHAIPSIAFNRGALSEIIDHEKSGLLVQGPHVPEIASAIRRILDEPDFAQALATAGRARVRDNFSADRMIDSTLRVYEQVLAESSPKRTPKR